MIIGTHDTMTFCQPKNKLYKPLCKFAKCQDLNLEEQVEIGCEIFDLRVRWHKSYWSFQHGIIEYKYSKTVIETLDFLNEKAKNKNTKFYIRFWNESTNKLSTEENKEWNKLIDKIKDKNYSNLIIGFALKSDWNTVVESYKEMGISNIEEVNEIMNPWYKIVKTPKYYAEKYRNERLSKLDKNCYVIGDFINLETTSKFK